MTQISFTRVQQAEWDARAETFHHRHPVLIRGNSGEAAMAAVEDNRALFTQLLAPQRHESLLEVGCGNGLFLQHFAPRVAMAAGIDLSLKMLEETTPGPRLQLLQASAHALPFVNASFDLLLNNAMLQYLPAESVPQFFSEIRRVLKPGGRALIAEIPLRQSLYGERNQLIDTARRLKRSIQKRDQLIYTRTTVAECSNALERVGLKIVRHQTHEYSTAFLPASLSRRVLDRCKQRGTYSPLFSSYYLFLCTRD